MKTLYIIAFLSMLFSSNILAQSPEVLLKTNAKGEVVAGSLEGLISYVNSGGDIRIGWGLDFDGDGTSELMHWVDANFISVMAGHVFNQIAPIYAQGPNFENKQVQLGNSPMQWMGLIGSNGGLLSRFIIPDLDKIEDEQMRKSMQEMTQISQEMVETIWVKN